MPAIKYRFYNATTKKQEEVEFYNYSPHLEKFVFLWRDASLEFWYSVVLSTDKKKLIKRISMGKSTRKIVFRRIKNMEFYHKYHAKGTP